EKFKSRIKHIISTKISINSDNMFSQNDAFRFKHWELSIAQYKYSDKKLFGVGPRNHPSIDIEELSRRSTSFHSEPFEKPHAHNMYLTKLSEEGLLGLTILILLLVFSLSKLYSHRKQNKDPQWLFIAGFGALVIPCIAGIFYAPYRREVAWVSILFIALFIHAQKKSKTINSASKTI
ncbi:hypothetical protein JYT10_00910, partial [Beggiatoa alba]|nr:hypothetical protein [Beggiatoa alba]